MSKKVYLKGNAHTPQKFWSYALGGDDHEKLYETKGFTYSEKDTKEYQGYTEEEKAKVKFVYVDGIKQSY